MQWELTRSSLGLRQRYREDHYEHVGRSPEEDRETRRRECRRLPDYGSCKSLVFPQRRSVVDVSGPRRRGLREWI
ncbi:hypothetical protein BHM03_00046874 [Ensete ventricosum]|nr:hypothetical protein BHM03_00046874 [Ensete ventricosum]